MSRIGDEYDNERPLVDNLVRFDNLTEKISEDTETLKEYIDVLNEYKAKMGTSEDNKTMRTRMSSEISEGNELIKRTLELFQDLEDLNFKKKKDIENYNKVVRRLNNTFNESYEKFTKTLKDIHSKEKIFVKVKQASITNVNNSFSDYSTSVLSSSEENNVVYKGNYRENGNKANYYNPSDQEDHNSEQASSARQSVLEVANDLDFYASVLREREEQVKHVRDLASEMDKFARIQHDRLIEQGEDLEVLVEHTNDVEANTVQANKELDGALKYQKKSTKRNICLTVLILVTCIVVAVVVFSITG